MAVENQPSVTARKTWERASGLEDRSKLPFPNAEPLGVFQGPPKTSQEGLMESAPVSTVDTRGGAPGEVIDRQAPRPTTFWAGAPDKEDAPLVPNQDFPQRRFQVSDEDSLGGRISVELERQGVELSNLVTSIYVDLEKLLGDVPAPLADKFGELEFLLGDLTGVTWG